MRSLTLLLIVVFIPGVLFSQSTYSWEKLEEFQDIYNPFGMYKINNEALVIHDIRNSEYPINLLSINGENIQITENLKSANGPGEVHSTFYKRVSTFSNGNILLWDGGRRALTKFSDDLKYLDDINGEPLNSSILQAGLINDSTLVLVENDGESIFKAYRIQENEIIGNDPLWKVSFDEYPKLNGLKNFILMQAMYLKNYENILYVTFQHSSIIIGLDHKGILFINDKPDENLFPEFDPENPTYSLPRMGSYEEGVRDFDVDGDYIFVIYKGETTSKWEQIRAQNRFDELIEEIKHSKRLLIYERITGDFVYETALPKDAKQISVVGNDFYLLNSLEDYPTIYRYQLNVN